MRARLSHVGMVRLGGPGRSAADAAPEEIGQRLKDDIGKWARVIEQAGIEKQ